MRYAYSGVWWDASVQHRLQFCSPVRRVRISRKFSIVFTVFFLFSLGTAAQDQQQETELVLEQGLNDYAGARDTTIFSESSLSNGGGQHLFSGNTGQNTTRRALIGFDLASIPRGATITSVSLFLTVSTTRAHRRRTKLGRWRNRQFWLDSHRGRIPTGHGQAILLFGQHENETGSKTLARNSVCQLMQVGQIRGPCRRRTRG